MLAKNSFIISPLHRFTASPLQRFNASLLCVALVFITAIATGCNEAEEVNGGAYDSSTHLSQHLHGGNVNQCDTPKGWDNCYEVYGSDLVYWQDTLSAPSWRTMVYNDTTGELESVVIDAKELNAGFIPTKSGQGIYPTENHFLDAYLALLGVNSLEVLANISIVQIDSTYKVSTAGDSISPYSTGNFILDALSDENGDITIENNVIEFQADLAEELTIISPNDGPTTTTSQSLHDSDSTVVVNGDLEARVGVWVTAALFVNMAQVKVNNLKRDGASSYVEFYFAGGLVPWFRRVSVTGNLRAYAEFCFLKRDYLWQEYDKQKDDAKSLRLMKAGPWAFVFRTPMGLAGGGRAIINGTTLSDFSRSAQIMVGCGYDGEY